VWDFSIRAWGLRRLHASYMRARNTWLSDWLWNYLRLWLRLRSGVRLPFRPGYRRMRNWRALNRLRRNSDFRGLLRDGAYCNWVRRKRRWLRLRVSIRVRLRRWSLGRTRCNRVRCLRLRRRYRCRLGYRLYLWR
jgi:hypothetical protein